MWLKPIDGLAYLFVILCLPSSWAEERLGTLQVDEIVLRPNFVVREKQEGEFSLGESLLGFTWRLDSEISSVVKLGSLSLINAPARFEKEPSSDLGVVEAYGQFRGNYGQLRFGLIPLRFGVEGSQSEGALHFPRSLLFKQRIVGLRDLGLGYFIQHNGYFTHLAVSNGEGKVGTDSRIFYTAHWGWSDEKNLRVGVAGQTGTTKPISTASSGDTLAGVDVNAEAKWRLGNVFLHWSPNAWDLVLEVSGGSLNQKGKTTGYSVAHMDLGYDFGSGWGTRLRYDHLDPNDSLSGDQVTEIGWGFVLRSRSSSSALHLVATKIVEEGNDVANDELRLIWHLSPKVFARQSRP